MDEPDMKDRLLDAAQDLVQRVGANAMSYHDLSNAVGIRKASIHYHFPTKSDLLLALIERYSTYFLKQVDEIAAEEVQGAVKLKRFMALFEATLRRDDCARACPCGMLGAEVATLDTRAHESLGRFYRALNQRTSQILEQGRVDESLAFSGKPEDLAWVIFSGLEGAMVVVRVEGGVSLFRRMQRTMQALLKA